MLETWLLFETHPASIKTSVSDPRLVFRDPATIWDPACISSFTVVLFVQCNWTDISVQCISVALYMYSLDATEPN